MKLSIREMAIFSMMGAVMYVSKIFMEFAPNVHLLGMFIVAFTVVYRQKALYPIYVYVLLIGVFSGFSAWFIPNLYIWTVLWGVVMLIPQKLPKKAKPIVYALVCSLHGFAFGILYAPVQAILFGLSFEGMIAWIVAGLPWDCIHGVSNLVCGFLIVPLVSVLQYLEKTTGKRA